MTNSTRIFAHAAGIALASLVVWSLGCEQIIGLDGPYAPAGNSGVCTEGATEECYSGDPALKGIGACQAGTRTCAKGAWGACVGEGAPSIESCGGNDDDCDGNGTCTGEVGWALSFGGPGNDSSSIVATDPSGNVVVAGYFDQPAAFGGTMLTPAGNNDFLVFKLDPSGKHIWSKSFGSTGQDYVRGMAVDPQGNIILAGGFGGPINFGGNTLTPTGSSLAVVKLNPNGDAIWSKSFVGAMGFFSTDVAADSSGNILISTTLNGTTDFGAGPQMSTEESLAVVKLDASGKLVFSKLFGSSMCCGNLRSAIGADSMGNVAVAGSFLGTMAFGNTMLTSMKKEVFVAKLSPTGDSLWAAQGTPTGVGSVEGLAVDTTGAIIFSGTFDSPTLTFGANVVTGYANADAFVVKFDTNGTFAWGKAFGQGGNAEAGAEVEVDDANNISFTGNTNSNSLDFGTGSLSPAGIFVVKLDSTGKTLWAQTSSVATTPFPAPAIAVDKQGHTFLTRSFLAPLTFGGVNLPSAGMSDVFVIKLGP